MRVLAWVVGLACLIYPNVGRTQAYIGTYVGDVSQEVKKLLGTDTYVRHYRLEMMGANSARIILSSDNEDLRATLQVSGKFESPSKFVGTSMVESGPPEWVRDRDRGRNRIELVFFPDLASVALIEIFMDNGKPSGGQMAGILKRTGPPPTRTAAPSQSASAQPSFNCAAAKSASARLICSDAELSNADAALATGFQRVVKMLEGDAKKLQTSEQVKWIRERNLKCQLDNKARASLEELQSAKPCLLSEIKQRTAYFASAPLRLPTANGEKASKAEAAATPEPREDTASRYVINVKFDPEQCRSTSVGISGEVKAEDSHVFLTDAELEPILSELWNRVHDVCIRILRENGPLPGVTPGTLHWVNLRLLDASPLISPYLNMSSQDGIHFQGENNIREGLLRLNREREAAIEQQRQQMMFDAARRQQAEQARQQEIAQARIDAQSGDPLIGNWKGNSNGVTVVLRITKDGDLYLVHGANPCCDLLNGDWAGPYKGSQILINHMLGAISVLQSSTRLTFGGVMYQKVGQ